MKRIAVLDTQVWLDWLHFADPRCAALERCHRAGALEIVIDATCREEWLRVLGYPVFALDAAGRAALVERLDARAVQVEAPGCSDPRRLPRCRDPDDQKFVELAVRCRAQILLTRDLALLALHRPLQRDFGLSVLPPQALADPVD